MSKKLNIMGASKREYSYLTVPASASDLLYDTDLTLKRALAFIPAASRDDYWNMWKWFIRGSIDNEVGSRLFGKRLPGVTFPHVAQRGIHVPSEQRYAASVTSKERSIYSGDGFDGVRQDLGDGTWLMFYSAHRNNKGNETVATWNAGLLNCLYDGVPVGVFMAAEDNKYRRALAYVEAYDPSAGMFTLHGPVTAENEGIFIAPEQEDIKLVEAKLSELSIDELESDSRKRVLTTAIRREGQNKFRDMLLDAYGGTCAVSGCSVKPVLQGAHIVSYRGKHSNIASNGLLLRADIHVLYDRYLLSVEPSSHNVILSSALADGEYASMHEKQILVPSDASKRPDDNCLNLHYRRFLKLQEAC